MLLHILAEFLKIIIYPKMFKYCIIKVYIALTMIITSAGK